MSNYLQEVFKEINDKFAIRQHVVNEAATKQNIDPLITFLMHNEVPSEKTISDFKKQFNFTDDEYITGMYIILHSLLMGVGTHYSIPDKEFDSKKLKHGIDVEKQHVMSDQISTMLAKNYLIQIPSFYDIKEA